MFFLSSLRAVSRSVFFLHHAGFGIVMWTPGPKRFWLNGRLHGVALRLSSAFRYFTGLRRRRRVCIWIDAFSNHAWMKDVFWNKLMTDWGWTLKKTFPDTLVRFVPFTILFDCIYHRNIHKTLRLNHCSESKAKSVFLPLYFHCVILAAPAVSAVLHRITSCSH